MLRDLMPSFGGIKPSAIPPYQATELRNFGARGLIPVMSTAVPDENAAQAFGSGPTVSRNLKLCHAANVRNRTAGQFLVQIDQMFFSSASVSP